MLTELPSMDFPPPQLPYRFEFEPHEHAAIKACNDEHGFAIVKGLIDHRYVEELKAEVLRVLDPAGQLKPGDAPFCLNFIEEAPALWKLFDFEPFISLYAHLLGTNEMTIHRTAAIVRMPPGGPMNWHSDFSFTKGPPQHNGDVLNRGEWPNGAWFYLNGTHPSRGGLAIIPDSHLLDWEGPQGFALTEKRDSFYPAGEPENRYTGFDVPGLLPLYSDPGDMLLFAARTYHAVFPHHGDEPRLSCAVVLRPRSIRIQAPWELPESARRFIETAPASVQPFLDGYTGIARSW
jgi:hypothetical protein